MLRLRRWEVRAYDPDTGEYLPQLPDLADPRYFTKAAAEREAAFRSRCAEGMGYAHRYAARRHEHVTATAPLPAAVGNGVDDFLEMPDALGERRERPPWLRAPGQLGDE